MRQIHITVPAPPTIPGAPVAPVEPTRLQYEFPATPQPLLAVVKGGAIAYQSNPAAGPAALALYHLTLPTQSIVNGRSTIYPERGSTFQEAMHVYGFHARIKGRDIEVKGHPDIKKITLPKKQKVYDAAKGKETDAPVEFQTEGDCFIAYIKPDANKTFPGWTNWDAGTQLYGEQACYEDIGRGMVKDAAPGLKPELEHTGTGFFARFRKPATPQELDLSTYDFIGVAVAKNGKTAVSPVEAPYEGFKSVSFLENTHAEGMDPVAYSQLTAQLVKRFMDVGEGLSVAYDASRAPLLSVMPPMPKGTPVAGPRAPAVEAEIMNVKRRIDIKKYPLCNHLTLIGGEDKTKLHLYLIHDSRETRIARDTFQQRSIGLQLTTNADIHAVHSIDGAQQLGFTSMTIRNVAGALEATGGDSENIAGMYDWLEKKLRGEE